MKMEPKVKEVIDLDFDPDNLVNILRKLNLKTDSPDPPESLNEDEINTFSLTFGKNCSIKQFSDKENGEIKLCSYKYTKNNETAFINIKNEVTNPASANSIPDQLSSEDNKPLSISIKKEINSDEANIDGFKLSFDIGKLNHDVLLNKCYTNILNVNENFKADISVKENSHCSISLKDKTTSPILLNEEFFGAKSEISSDSDTDENEIITRGPGRKKKLYNKREQFGKQCRPIRNTNAFNLDQQLSSFHADQNNEATNLSPLQTENASTNFDYIDINNYSVSSPSESDFGISQSSCLCSSPPSGFYSPFPSSDFHSPTSKNCLYSFPPSFSFSGHSQGLNIFETSEDEAFFDFVLNLEKSPESSNIYKSDCNIPTFDNKESGHTEKYMNNYREINNSQKLLHHSTAQNMEILTHEVVSDEYLHNIDSVQVPLSPKILSKGKDFFDDVKRDLVEKLKNDFKASSSNQEQFHKSTIQNSEILTCEAASAECLPNIALVKIPSSPIILSKPLNLPVLRNKYRKISFKLNDNAKHRLRHSGLFNEERYIHEQTTILKEIRKKEQCGSKIKIIEYEEEEVLSSEKLQRTNLHSAVLKSNVEKVYCLIEALKRYQLPFSGINHRDADGKTALDYAVRNKMPLVIDYLKENNAVQGIVL